MTFTRELHELLNDLHLLDERYDTDLYTAVVHALTSAIEDDFETDEIEIVMTDLLQQFIDEEVIADAEQQRLLNTIIARLPEFTNK